MRRRTDSLVDPDGRRLPIKLDTTSNGEFEPVPLSPANVAANRLAHEAASRNAKRLNLSRRDFLITACGAASTLLAFNAANAAAGKRGGWFDLQIQAFRTFQISPELRAKHGYPEITPALRTKIFGLNATRIYPVSPDVLKKLASDDRIARERLAYGERPDPHYLTYGPRTRREFLNLRRLSGTAL